LRTLLVSNSIQVEEDTENVG